MTDVITTDIRLILAEHEIFHARLKAGEFPENDGSYDKALADGQLHPLMDLLGGKGLGELVHLVHELVVEVVANERDTLSAHDVSYVRRNVEQLMGWYMEMAFAEFTQGLHEGPGLHLDETGQNEEESQ